MPTVNLGPGTQGASNIVAALETVGVGLFANLTSATLVPAGTFAYTTDQGVVVSNGTTWLRSDTGMLVNIQVLKSGTVYTPSTNATSVTVIAIGGGGGGGGASGTAANYGAAGGGGSGAFGTLTNYLLSNTPWTYAIGSAGTAGAGATPAAGGTGGNTTVTDSKGTNILTAPGGVGGALSAYGTAAVVVGGGAGGTIATSSASSTASSTILLTGEAGGVGYTGGITGDSFAGYGGNSPYGSGGSTGALTGGAGVAGSGYGAGGGGGLSAGANENGGAGTAGLLIIYEYS